MARSHHNKNTIRTNNQVSFFSTEPTSPVAMLASENYPDGLQDTELKRATRNPIDE